MGEDSIRESPWKFNLELSPEQEEELIDKLAERIHKHSLGLMFLVTIESLGPLTRIGAELGSTLFGPYLDFLGMEEIVVLLRKSENIDRLIEKVELLDAEKKKAKQSK